MTGSIRKSNLRSFSTLFGFSKRAAGNREKQKEREEKETYVSHKLSNSFLCIKNDMSFKDVIKFYSHNFTFQSRGIRVRFQDRRNKQETYITSLKGFCQNSDLLASVHMLAIFCLSLQIHILLLSALYYIEFLIQ